MVARRPALLLVLFALSGCGLDAPPSSRDPSAGPQSHGQAPATMEFRGRRPCVDCVGIEAWLRLVQDGEDRRYTMVERYLDAGGERRFEEQGEWIADGDVLRLQGDDGGLRVYARMPDHGLQARASDGGPLAAASDDVMTPTTFEQMR